MTLAQAVLGSDLTGARPTLPARAPRALRAQKRNIIQRAVNGESGAQSGAAGAPTPAAYPGQFPPGPPGADQRGEFPDMRYQVIHSNFGLLHSMETRRLLQGSWFSHLTLGSDIHECACAVKTAPSAS